MLLNGIDMTLDLGAMYTQAPGGVPPSGVRVYEWAPGRGWALMARVQQGDEAALAALMDRWELPVKRVIARIVFNVGEAEELAQETFVRVWQQREKFRDGAEVKPWVLSIAVNLARNRLRWWRRMTRPGCSARCS